MAMAETNVIKMPAALDTLAAGIKADLKRTEHGRNEWIEGTLGLAAKLKQARGEFKADIAFGVWIDANAIAISKEDRAALINMAADLGLAKDILRKSERSSWRYIWKDEMMYRFLHAAKPIQTNSGHNSKSVLDAIKASAGVPDRALAQQLGLSLGKVQRERRKLKEQALGKTKPKPVGPTLAEQNAIRNARPRFDDKTREERGMGSREYGAQQHPDYPPGWTNDVVHREKYGRIQIFTPAEKEQHDLIDRFIHMLGHLRRLAEDIPTPAELDQTAGAKTHESIVFHLRKLVPQTVEKLNGLLQKLAA